MTIFVTTFLIILVAEMGDKSQLVCMLLASRHKKSPVILGASIAFSLLNLLAVTVGASLATVIPELWLKWLVVGLFVLFGVQSLAQRDDDEVIQEKSHTSVFVTTFLMIFVAELGDKTQIAVSALGASTQPVWVYLGATLALIVTSTLGALFGSWISNHIKEQTLHRISGFLFIGFAIWLALDTLNRSMPVS